MLRGLRVVSPRCIRRISQSQSESQRSERRGVDSRRSTPRCVAFVRLYTTSATGTCTGTDGNEDVDLSTLRGRELLLAQITQTRDRFRYLVSRADSSHSALFQVFATHYDEVVSTLQLQLQPSDLSSSSSSSSPDMSACFLRSALDSLPRLPVSSSESLSKLVFSSPVAPAEEGIEQEDLLPMEGMLLGERLTLAVEDMKDLPVQLDMAMDLTLRLRSTTQQLRVLLQDAGGTTTEGVLLRWVDEDALAAYEALDTLWWEMLLRLNEGDSLVARLVFESRKVWPQGMRTATATETETETES